MIKEISIAIAIASMASQSFANKYEKVIKELNVDSSYKSASFEFRRNEIVNNNLLAAQGKQLDLTSASNPQQLTGSRDWLGRVIEDHVLAILIEFPDNKKDQISELDTRNFYPGFLPDHYRQMLFSPNGYQTPEGKNVLSMSQYLFQQSGGSYRTDGEVFGWYEASQPMAYYGARTDWEKDVNPRELVKEALMHAINESDFDMSYFDQKDPGDLNNNGILNEPDGIIDHVSIFHSAIDEAAGGKQSAIWSHRSSLDFEPVELTEGISAHFYTIQPIDAAAGIVAHEFGHDLGLPDEYDIEYSHDDLSSVGSTIGYWSIMAHGNDLGDIPGTEPSGYSPFAKQFLQSTIGGNWLVGTTISSNELSSQPKTFKLNAAATAGEFNDYIRIDLPEKETELFKPKNHQSLSTSSEQNILVFGQQLAAGENSLSFDLNVMIDDYSGDFFAAAFDEYGIFELLPISYINDQNQLVEKNFIDESTNGWVTATVDLNSWSNEFVEVALYGYKFGGDSQIIAIDNFSLQNNNQTQFDLSAQTLFASDALAYVEGFSLDDGQRSHEHYYLVEWRAHEGIDESLKQTLFGPYDPGMLVWYVNTQYGGVGDQAGQVEQGDNSVGYHPGEGWLSIVDANRNLNYQVEHHYDKETLAFIGNHQYPGSSRMQVKDAAFNTKVFETSSKYLGMFEAENFFYMLEFQDLYNNNNSMFIDWDDYSNYLRPATGTKLSQYGIVISVAGQSQAGDTAEIEIAKHW